MFHLNFQQCFKHLPKQKPPFSNIPEEWTGETGILIENEVAVTPGKSDLSVT